MIIYPYFGMSNEDAVCTSKGRIPDAAVRLTLNLFISDQWPHDKVRGVNRGSKSGICSQILNFFF